MAKPREKPTSGGRTETAKPAAKRTKPRDRLDRSTEAVIETGHVREAVPPADALPARHTVDSRRRS